MKTTLFRPLESHGDPINNLHVESVTDWLAHHTKVFQRKRKGRKGQAYLTNLG
jgi:hypothetical protein